MNRARGMSLLELLVVVALIATLAGIGAMVIGRAMPQGDILGFAPPLCLTRAESDVVVDAAASAIKAVLG